MRVAFKDTCSAAARPSRAATVGAGKGKEAHRPAFSRSGLTLLMQWSSIVVVGRNQPDDMAHRTLHVTGVVGGGGLRGVMLQQSAPLHPIWHQELAAALLFSHTLTIMAGCNRRLDGLMDGWDPLSSPLLDCPLLPSSPPIS